MGTNEQKFLGGGLGTQGSLLNMSKDLLTNTLRSIYVNESDYDIDKLVHALLSSDNDKKKHILQLILEKTPISLILSIIENNGNDLIKNININNKNIFKNNFLPKLVEPKNDKPSESIDWEDPASIKKYLDKYVSGQDNAKKLLASAFSDYIQYGIISHSLLIGTSGSGKTYMLKIICDAAGIPFVKISMANVTSSGYKGENLSQKMQALKGQKRAIVFLDEFDKLAVGSSDKNVDGFGEALQKELLTYFSGDKVDGIDSSNFLIITAGAFNGGFGQLSLSGIIQQRLGGNKSSLDKKTLLHQVSKEDLVRYGLMPELVGRLVNIATLEPLDEEALYNILANTENSVLKLKISHFKKMGINLEFEDEAIRLIAKNSVKGVGARGLESIINELTQIYSFNRVSHKGEKITITTRDVKELIGKEVEFEKVDDIDVDWSSAKSIFDYMNFYAVGQERAKKALAASFVIYNRKLNNPEMDLPQPNSLLIGPSGSGKTFLVDLISKKAGIPVTGMNLAGVSIAEFRSKLADIAYNGKGIVFLDEADKVLLSPTSPFINELISCLENGKVNGVDLSGVMFILAGAFQGLYEGKSNSSKSIGFGTTVGNSRDYRGLEINADDLENNGVPLEIIGRVPNIVPLEALGVDDLVKIMKKPGSELKKFINFFNSSNIELVISDIALNIIATKAKAKLGARSIRAILNALFNPFIQNIDKYVGGKIEINQDSFN